MLWVVGRKRPGLNAHINLWLGGFDTVKNVVELKLLAAQNSSENPFSLPSVIYLQKLTID